jgi:hypothetical protein
MAARKIHTTLREEWKEKIRASMLINRLQDHAFGEVEMSATQLKAAEILLRKVAPDLGRQEVSGPEGGKIEIEATWGKPE